MIALGLGDGKETQLLPAMEIARWAIHAGVVVLSGCESAAGPVLPATGLMGLTRAWLRAGAGAVVASRWPTPDDEGELFRSLYRDLGRSAASGTSTLLPPYNPHKSPCSAPAGGARALTIGALGLSWVPNESWNP